MVLSLLVSTRNARNKIIMNLQPAIHPFSLTCLHEGCVEAETESEPKNLRAHEKQNNAPQKACVCVCLSIWLGQQIPTDNGNGGQESKWRIVSPGGSGSGVSGTGGVGSADSSSDRAGSDGIVKTSDLGGTWSDDTETSGSDCCPQVQAGAAHSLFLWQLLLVFRLGHSLPWERGREFWASLRWKSWLEVTGWIHAL